MSNEINIRVNVADKIYPLKVTSEEEERVRSAAKRLNDRISQYKQNFGVQDKHDLLAMCALEFATEAENMRRDKSAYEASLNEKLKAVEELLNIR